MITTALSGIRRSLGDIPSPTPTARDRSLSERINVSPSDGQESQQGETHQEETTQQETELEEDHLFVPPSPTFEARQPSEQAGIGSQTPESTENLAIDMVIADARAAALAKIEAELNKEEEELAREFQRKTEEIAQKRRRAIEALQRMF
ncbi:hypothetical protein N7535_008859 [Penicillium sp. DV-2018c]|nr:hypothetical protein N7461_002615 [Penicillium sp. DV-2018c]KAJ5563695.1 hypothetical protein N7535_008859 [Penicillium sp. DV-2018c]